MPPVRSQTVYGGIDPGGAGGFAFIYGDGLQPRIETLPTPGTQRDVCDLLRLRRENLTATVEWIHPAIPAIGKAPMAKLYGSYMSLQMALTALEIPFEIVQPVKWQHALGISRRGKTETTVQWKNRLKARAQQLFPQHPVTLKTADALLISQYCRLKATGKLGP